MKQMRESEKSETLKNKTDVREVRELDELDTSWKRIDSSIFFKIALKKETENLAKPNV